jgi:hypothetical protein
MRRLMRMLKPTLSTWLGLAAATAALSAFGPGRFPLAQILLAASLYRFGVERAHDSRQWTVSWMPRMVPRLLPLVLAIAGEMLGLMGKQIAGVGAYTLFNLAVWLAALIIGYRAGNTEEHSSVFGPRYRPIHYGHDLIYGPTGSLLGAALAAASLTILDQNLAAAAGAVIIAGCAMIAVRYEPKYVRSFDAMRYQLIKDLPTREEAPARSAVTTAS